MQESTSYQWIINKVNETFNLKMRGKYFLRGNKIKIEYVEGSSTYSQERMLTFIIKIPTLLILQI